MELPARKKGSREEKGELSSDADEIQVTKRLRAVVDDDMIDECEDDVDNIFGFVCALCHDGGDLLCCEGRCRRSFHATPETGRHSGCETLGFTKEEADAIPNFVCQNCKYKQHQCFLCGELGSSDNSSGVAEVVPCNSSICGQFYHPHCVSIELSEDYGVPAEELEKRIATGESFTCPAHKCRICKQGENKKDHSFQFAICMRCPRSYHRKCLPREIAFEKQGEMLKGRSITRAWDGLLPDRILMYCTKHDIDIEIGTVRRDHIKFPDDEQNTSSLKKKTILEEKWKPLSEFLVKGNKVVSKRNIPLEKSHKGKNAATDKKTKKLSAQQPVSKKSHFSPKKSAGHTSDPVSKLVKQKLLSGKERKTIGKGCKREKSGKPYTNKTKQEERKAFDLAPQPDSHFSRGSYLAGQNSVYDPIRAFSSSFYSHIHPADDSLSSINRLAMPSDADILVDPTGPQPGCLDSSIMGFAPGPHLNYSIQNSAGWIDE